MTPSAEFVFVACQNGAESLCKHEILRHHPELKLAYSKPGLLTFKVCLPADLLEKSEPRAISWLDSHQLVSTFARTHGTSLGRVAGADLNANVMQVLSLVGDAEFDEIHVWQRDSSLPGDRGFEPFISVLAEEVGTRIVEQLNAARTSTLELNRTARSGKRVLDVVIVEPNEWIIGWHSADSIAQRWPGGVPPIDAPDPIISRAYFKLVEAIQWGRVPIAKGDICVEIGSAPGGAAQRLLEIGAKVIAIDPADLDESLREHPALRHIKKRGKHVRKAELAGARWLLVDVNVAPNYTLDTAEEIVTSPRTHIRGMILTLKLTSPELADHIEGFRYRVRNWGFKVVRTRQLAFNRHEICLVALKTQYDQRPRPSRRSDKKKQNVQPPTNKS